MVGTEAARVPPDEVRVSAELALPGKKLLLAPSFRFFFFFPEGAAQCGGPLPPNHQALPILTRLPNLSSPLRFPCTAGRESRL